MRSNYNYINHSSISLKKTNEGLNPVERPKLGHPLRGNLDKGGESSKSNVGSFKPFHYMVGTPAYRKDILDFGLL